MGMITLLTDFGHTDTYVGVMKGVITGIAPRCQIVDITHGIGPQDILAARFGLLASYGYFPAGTIHVVVVDPGVGTQRIAVAAQVTTPVGDHTIVAPDNGIFTGFSITRAVALKNSRYWRTSQPSHTFHGRDIFAPVAAHLANGVRLESLGPAVSIANLVTLKIGDAIASHHGYRGSIQYIDHFGNLITTIPADKLTQPDWYVQLSEQRVPYYATYGQAMADEALALIGSHGYVEIAVNGGSAAQRFSAQVGDPVELIYAPRG